MRFLSYFHDPDNLFLPLLEELELPEELKGSIVAVTPETTVQIYEKLKDTGFNLVEGGPYGYGRIVSLKHSLTQNDSQHFFVCDFDKMLHWLDTDRDEFVGVLRSTPDADVTVIARGPKALATYPKAWVETEQIATKILSKALGQEVDLMNGPYILSKKAAEMISVNSTETGVGSCAEWCLLAKQANLSIQNREVEGLTWEDPDRYYEAIQKTGDYDKWKEQTFDSLYEWRKRVEFLHKQVMVMIRLTEEPINPKYPYVHNQTLNQR